MPMGKCIFSDSLKQQFPFRKQSRVGGDGSKWNVRCAVQCLVLVMGGRQI
jgi:hypothetical protein